jgi:hypothetical protein
MFYRDYTRQIRRVKKLLIYIQILGDEMRIRNNPDSEGQHYKISIMCHETPCHPQ